MNAHIKAMVQLELFTGCRHGEACAFSMDQVTEEGGVWLYRPRQHKTRHRDRDRVVPIGPRARAVLDEFMRTHTWSADAPLFCPYAAELDRHAARSAARKVAWQAQRRVKRRKAAGPGTKYTTSVLAANIRRACAKAGVPRWAPNQLRHLFAGLVVAR